MLSVPKTSKVPLPQAVRLHQVTQNVNWAGIRNRVTVSLEIFNQEQQKTHQLLFG